MGPTAPAEIQVWVVPLDDPHATGHPDLPARARANVALRRILAEAVGRRADELSLVVRATGKPGLADGAVEFNLSHSGSWALVAVAPAGLPVGVDLEKRREFRAHERLTRRICSEREYAHVMAEGAAADELLRLWVRKEAVVKASGEGVGSLLGGVDVLDDVSGPWRVLDLQAPEPGYRAALAHAGDAVPVLDRQFAW